MSKTSPSDISSTSSKMLNWLSLTVIYAGFHICVSAIMVGYLIWKKVNFASLSSLMIASCASWILAMGFARLGVQQRKVFSQLAVVQLGSIGAKICGFSFAVALSGWFAIQLNLMSETLCEMFPMLEYRAVNVLLGVGITLLILKEIVGIKKVAAASVPVLILALIYILYKTSQEAVSTLSTATFSKNAMPDWTCVPLIIAFSIVGVIDTPTYASKCIDEKNAYLGISIIYLVLLPCIAFVGILLAIHNPHQDVVASIMHLEGGWWPLFALIFLIFAGLTTNNGNLYSGIKALEPFSWSYSHRVWLLGGLGTSISLFPIMEHLSDFLSSIVILNASLGGTILGRFLGKGLKFSPTTLFDKRFYLTITALGAMAGIAGQMGIFSLSGYGFLDGFLCAFVFSVAYELYRNDK
jgi:purine-cytosine permease-like protein